MDKHMRRSAPESVDILFIVHTVKHGQGLVLYEHNDVPIKCHWLLEHIGEEYVVYDLPRKHVEKYFKSQMQSKDQVKECMEIYEAATDFLQEVAENGIEDGRLDDVSRLNAVVLHVRQASDEENELDPAEAELEGWLAPDIVQHV